MLDGIYGASFFLSKLLDNKGCTDLQEHPLSAEDGTEGYDLTSVTRLSYAARLKSKIEYIKNYIITNNLADLGSHGASPGRYGQVIRTEQAALPDGETDAGPVSTGEEGAEALPEIPGRLSVSGQTISANNGDGLQDVIEKVATYAGNSEIPGFRIKNDMAKDMTLGLSGNQGDPKNTAERPSEQSPGGIGDIVLSFPSDKEGPAPIKTGSIAAENSTPDREDYGIIKVIGPLIKEENADLAGAMKAIDRVAERFDIGYPDEGRGEARSPEYGSRPDDDEISQPLLKINNEIPLAEGGPSRVLKAAVAAVNAIYQDGETVPPGVREETAIRYPDAGSGSPAVNSERLPAESNDEGVSVFMKKIAGFAGHVNELLSLLNESDDPIEKNDGAIREAIKGVLIPAKHTMPSRMILTEIAGDIEQQAVQSGIKINEQGLLSIDGKTLGRFLSSKGDEGVSIVKSFANVLYDRMLMYLGAGSLGLHVVNDSSGRHAVHNADGRIDTRLEEKRQELEKKMDVLQMLIERSRTLKDELAKQL